MDSLDYSSLRFPVRVDLVPSGQTTQRTGIDLDPRFITIHETDNRRMGARGHNTWLHGGAKDDHGNVQKLSVHFFVDDREAFQCIPLDEVGWHAGDGRGPGNLTSLAIETCVNQDADFDQTRTNVAALTRLLMEAFDIPIENVVQHNHWRRSDGTHKDCPKRMRHEVLWENQLERVRGHLQPVRFDEFPEPRTYHVPRGRRATARTRPARNASVVEHFDPLTIVECDGAYQGEEVRGDATWLRTADERHLAIHASGLVEGEPTSRIPVELRVAVGGGPWETLDGMNDEIAAAAAGTDVPPHLIKAMLAREGSFGRDWGKPPVQLPGRPSPVLPFNGIFRTTAERRGIDWDRMCRERAYAIFAMAEVLRQIKEQQADEPGFEVWEDVAGYYFAGPNWNNPDWDDGIGNTVHSYKFHPEGGVIIRMRKLDALLG
jgi:hypothetical protein